MKQYHDYKKLYRIISILVFLAVFISPAIFSQAQTASELNQKINQKNDDISRLEREIDVYQSQIEKLSKEKSSLGNSIQQLDISKKKLVADIAVSQNKIDKTNFKLAELGMQIGDKESIISNNIVALRQEIKRTNELDFTTPIETILSDVSFTDIWNDINDIATVQESIINRTAQLRDVKVQLEDTRQKTADAKKELVRLQGLLSDQKKVVEQNTSDKKKLLSQTKNSESNYQKLLASQLAKKEAFEKELRDYESQLKFILDPTKLPGAGVLSWPLSYIYVTQEFGAKTGPHRTYASGHSGADFRARTPLPAMAMADGVVKGIGDTDLACPGASFGRWVFIEYNNGLSSTYGHLSTINVREGQAVKRGQVVAYTGGTGRVTGPHLHVSLYVSSAVKVDTVPSISCPGHILKQPIAPTNAYLDPMYYLPPYVAP